MPNPKYSYLKGLWKASRPALVAVACILLANYQDILPPSVLTPVVVLVFEFLRNYFKQNKLISVK